MNIALIFAGGTGQRMSNRGKPKQFLELHGKPIIIYTLEHFQKHGEIDKILVVCLKEWIEELKEMIRWYEIDKTINIVPGGQGGYASIYNGLKALEDVCKNDDIVLIHDGVRPLITYDLISENIEIAKKHKAAITVGKAVESIVKSVSGKRIEDVPPRESMYLAKAPQSFEYGLIWELYKRANKDDIPTIDSAHLCNIYNVDMHIIKSCDNNIKITTPSDYYIFKALYEAMENQQIMGI